MVLELTLHQTYWNQGFFNVPRDFDHLIGEDGESVTLTLNDGDAVTRTSARVNWTANRNGTPRIMGGTVLRDWFQANFEVLDVVHVHLGADGGMRMVRPGQS